MVTDADMAHNARLAADDDAPADAGAPRDAYLCHDYRVLAHYYIMGDLHEIVYFDAFLNPGPAQSRPVDGGIGADLHVVVDLDDADLEYLTVFLPGDGKSEPVAADHDPGMEDDAPAYKAALIDRDVGIKYRIRAYGCIVPDHDTGMENGPGVYSGPGAYIDLGVDRRFRIHFRAGGDKCLGMNPRRRQWASVEQLQGQTEGRIGIGNDEEVFPGAFETCPHQYRPGAGSENLLLVFRVGQKGQFSFLGLVQPVDPLDQHRAVPDYPAAQMDGQLA